MIERESTLKGSHDGPTKYHKDTQRCTKTPQRQHKDTTKMHKDAQRYHKYMKTCKKEKKVFI